MSPSFSASAPRLLRHSSYAVMLGQEPSLRSTFPRAGGAREASPITIKHCWPWAALGGSLDSRNCAGRLGSASHCFHRPYFCQVLQDHVHPQRWQRAQMAIAQSPAPRQPDVYFWIWGVLGFVSEIPVQQEFVFIA